MILDKKMSSFSEISDLLPDRNKQLGDISIGSFNSTADNPLLDTSLQNEMQKFLAGLRSFEELIENAEPEHFQAMSCPKQLLPERDVSKEDQTKQPALQNVANISSLSNMSDPLPNPDKLVDNVDTTSYMTTADNPLLDTSLHIKVQEFLAGLRSFEEQIDNAQPEHVGAVNKVKQLLPEQDISKPEPPPYTPLPQELGQPVPQNRSDDKCSFSDMSDLTSDPHLMIGDSSLGSYKSTADKAFLDTSLQNEMQEFLNGLTHFERQIEYSKAVSSQVQTHSKQPSSKTDTEKHLSQDNKEKKENVLTLQETKPKCSKAKSHVKPASPQLDTYKSLPPPYTSISQEPRQDGLSQFPFPPQNTAVMLHPPRVYDIKPESRQLLDISTGSYRNLPTTQPFVIEDYPEPVYNFSETNRKNLIIGLSDVEQHVKDLELQNSNYVKQLLPVPNSYIPDTHTSLSQDKTGPQQPPAFQNVPGMSGFSGISAVKSGAFDMLDISIGSYQNLPSKKPLINDEHLQTSQVPVYSFPEPNTQALMLGLKSIEQRLETLETECNQAQQLSQDNTGKYEFLKGMTLQQANELISSLSATERRHALLQQKIKELKQMARNAERNRVNLQKGLENQRLGTVDYTPSSEPRVSLNQFTGIERRILQHSVIENIAKDRILVLEQSLKIEKKQKDILEMRVLELSTQFNHIDTNVQNVFASLKSEKAFLLPSVGEITSSPLNNCHNLDDLFVHLQKEFAQMTWKHQYLTEQLNRTTDRKLQEDVEIELDNLVTQMEIKAMQMIKIRKALEKLKKESKFEKRKKLETGQSICKSKPIFIGDNLRSLKKAERNVSMRRLLATLRQEDLRWV